MILQKQVLSLCLLCIIPLFTNGQDNTEFIVSGTVKDANTGDVLQMATVTLLHPYDSSIVAGATTDTNGAFTVRAQEGRYIFKAQFISYQSYFQPGIRLNESNPSKQLGTIRLEEEQRNLEEVVIEGEQSRMTMEGGKKIFNVGSDLSTSGASAADVLDNIPAVSMDVEGNLSLRGSQGVRILVNGKPSSMMGISSSEALRYFPANQIKRVEIITNPSAKYEAQGAAGIINIILKENQNWGLNGNFTVEGGIPKDHGASVNMNYRKKWYNIFGSYNFSVDRYNGGGWREQTFNYPDTTYSLRTDTDRDRGGRNHYLQLGTDLYFTPNEILKVSGVYNVENEENYTDIEYLDYTGSRVSRDDLVSRTIRKELEVETESDYELNLNYEKTIGKEDHKLTADFQIRNNSEVEDGDLDQLEGLPGEQLDTTMFQRSLNDTEVYGYLAKFDYTWPFSEDGKFETGFRGEYRDLKNIYRVEQRALQSDPWQNLEQFTNTFLYDEEIYGAYAMYGNRRGKFSYQGGLRFEYTRIITELVNDNRKNDRSYYNFFPSLSVTYELSALNSIQVSYSRRLDRPHFRELNPFNTFSDNRNYRTGNPNLDPEFTGAYDLGFINNNEKSSIYIGAFYRRTINEIERVDTVNNEGITVAIPQNLVSRDNAGIEARYSAALFDWWDFSISSFFYHGSTSGFAAGEDLNSSAYTMDARASFDFDVKEWFEFQINADYRAPEREGQDTEQAMYEIDLGFRKEVLNKKGNIALSIRDLFNTDIYRSEVDGSNFTARNRFQWRQGPIFSLSLSYELNDSGKESGRGDYDRGG